jgi:pimeloyl-ACP methyl ester carboxylesterase
MRLSIFFLVLLFVRALPAGESVTIDIGAGPLYGTLELPALKPPFPVALIISGSGPTDRDGNSRVLSRKNNSLKMLAEGMASQGIASLRYDKRGIGESKRAGLKEEDLRLETYVDDAVRWGQYLRRDSRFRTVVIIGHSEGSLIGMLAARKLPADGYISIAGAGRPGGQVILTQLRSQPIPPDLMKQVEDIVSALEQGRTVDSIPQGFGALFRESVQPYLISWFRYDPAKEIAKLAMPVLILQGSTDIQASVSEVNLLAGAKPNAKLVVIEGMNHMLKEVPEGRDRQIASYSDPSLPLAAKLLDEISRFVASSKLQN